jgi:excisionase family DNA binding protein
MVREYYSIPEAAALLGVSRIAVFKKVKKGQLPAIRFGRNWAVPASALGPAPAAPRQKIPLIPPAPVLPAKKKEAEQPPPSSDAEMDSMGWD